MEFSFKRLVYNSSTKTAKVYIPTPDGDALEVVNSIKVAAADLSWITEVPVTEIKIAVHFERVIVYAENCKITHKPTGVELDVL